MMKFLKDKVAIITGAAGGLGYYQAMEYARQGAIVVITDIQKEKLKNTEKELKEKGAEVLAILSDISSKDEVNQLVEQTLEHFGHIDICVNNAAVLADFKPLGDITEDEWDRIMSVNLKGMYLLTHRLLPHFISRQEGVFINVASIGGTIAGVGDGAYIASKHGVIGLTRQLTYDYAKDGIRAVALCPGLTRTPMVDYAIEDGHPQALRQVNSIASGQIGQPEDVAFFSAYLASVRAKQINGATMVMDGGQSVGQEAKWVNPQHP